MSNSKWMTTVALLTSLAFTFPASADALEKSRARSCSDDAQSVEEAGHHGIARALVIQSVERNKLGVGGREFRVKRNPAGKGCFVYDPRTNASGVERWLVWWVVDDQTAYALNGPSKLVTPSLKWPREDGLTSPTTPEIIGYVFQKVPLPRPATNVISAAGITNTFTVKEYQVYRGVIDTPISISEDEALRSIGRRYGMTAAEAKACCRKVMTALSRNNWFGSATSEIKHASDYGDRAR